VERLVLTLLSWLDLVLQLFVRVDPRRVCYTSHPDYSDNAYHLFRYALFSRNNLEHVWTLRDKDAHEPRIRKDFAEITVAAGTTGNRLRIVKRKSLPGYWYYLTSRNVFHTHGMYIFPRYSIKRNIVSLWHGMPIKRIGAINPSSPQFYPTFGTLHIATSHFFKYIMATVFQAQPEQVLVCATPRIDVLQHPRLRTLDNREIRARMNLPTEKKLVLWLPTFRTEPSKVPTAKLATVRSFLDDISPDILKVLDQSASQQNAVVVIKLHSYDRLNDLETELPYPNFRLIKSTPWQSLQVPLYDLVAASDALLTDVSSILSDYLATGRPIGMIGMNPDSYARGISFPLSYLLNSGCFDQLNDAASIARFMASVGLATATRQGDRRNPELFLEPFDEPGSEHILRHLGL
jgi:CDP-glycerol glycerophosphotransferase (TagB/SpsB family)